MQEGAVVRPNKGPLSRIIVPFLKVIETNGARCRGVEVTPVQGRKPAVVGTQAELLGRGRFYNGVLLPSTTSGGGDVLRSPWVLCTDGR